MITCPCCGGVGRVEEKAPVPLSRMQQRIYDAVVRAGDGIGSLTLLEKVYAGDRGGGPEYASETVRVAIWRMNAKLGPKGYRIRADGGYQNERVYRLQRLSA